MSAPASDAGHRVCHVCSFRCAPKAFCPVCVAAFPFSMLHERVTELVGREIFTHELVDKDALIAEMRRGVPANLAEVLDKVPPGKLITIGLEGSGKGGAIS